MFYCGFGAFGFLTKKKNAKGKKRIKQLLNREGFGCDLSHRFFSKEEKGKNQKTVELGYRSLRNKNFSAFKRKRLNKKIKSSNQKKCISIKDTLTNKVGRRIVNSNPFLATAKMSLCPLTNVLHLQKESAPEVLKLGSLFLPKEELSKTLLCQVMLESKRSLLQKVLQDMKENGFAFKELHYYATLSQEESFGAVLKHLGQKDEKEPLTGYAPLHIAAASGNYDFAENLLCCGAKVNLKDKWGRTALHYAVVSENVELIYLLKEHGAYLNVQDSDGLTPLHIAVKKKKENSVSTLLVLGAEVNLKNKQGMTPRCFASESLQQLFDKALLNSLLLYGKN